MIELISVVLPMPLRPSKASALPAGMRNDTPSSTTASPYPAVSASIASTSAIGRLAKIDRLDARIAGDIVRGAFHEQRAVDEDRDAVGEAEHKIHVMLDEQHGDVFGQARNRRQQSMALGLG